MYDFLLALHILAAVLWVGGGATLHVIGRRAIASGDTARVVQFIRDADWVGPRFYAPLSVILLIAGFGLVADLELSLGEPWITIGLTAWVISFLVGVGYYPRAGARVEAAVAERGESDPSVLAGARQVTNVNSLELLILLVAVIAMATKPGL